MRELSAMDLGPIEIIVENGDYLGFANLTPEELGHTMVYLARRYGRGATYTIRPWTAIVEDKWIERHL